MRIAMFPPGLLVDGGPAVVLKAGLENAYCDVPARIAGRWRSGGYPKGGIKEWTLPS
jgi:hypothetical protein